MASLIGERVRFLHVPKTGGTWATHAMLAAGADLARPEDVPFHGDLAETSLYAGRFTFAFIRHPLEFWRSYWGYRMRTGWLEDFPIDAAASPDLNEFVERVLATHPGWASRLYERYVGQPGDEIDMVCRHERLAEDLCAALTLAGVDFDESRLLATPVANANDYSARPALYRPRTAELLAQAEAPAINRFYPWQRIPPHLLEHTGSGLPAPSRLSQRLSESELELRDAKARLAALRLRQQETERRLTATQSRLEDTQLRLARLHASRTLRWSQPLRVRWYKLREH